MKKKLFLFIFALLALIVCSCGESKPHEHTSAVDEGYYATCTVPGKTQGSHCSECGEVIVAQKEIPPLGHFTVDEPAVEPTCTSEGRTAGKYCTVCHEVILKSESISMTDHDFAEANCIAPKTCRICSFAEGEKAGHVMVETEEKAPTCTENGNTAGSQCSVCGFSEIATTVIEALGHTEVITDAVIPSAGNNGLTEGITCSTCGYVIVKAVDPAEYTLKYAYEGLGKMSNGKSRQALYDRIFEAALKFHLDTSLNGISIANQSYDRVADIKINDLGLTVDEMVEVRHVFYRENKHLFYWMDTNFSWNYNNKTNIAQTISVFVNDEYSNGEVRRELNLKIYRAVQGISSDADNQYDRLLDYYDSIAESMSYARNASGIPSTETWAHNAVGYVLYGKGVCESYTHIWTLLLNYRGIPCIHVTGSVYQNGKKIDHSWNLVQMDDGQWYWFDVTYCDTDSGASNYSFFCVSAEQAVSGGQSFLEYENRTPNTETDSFCQVVLPERSSNYYMAQFDGALDTLKKAYELKIGERLGGGAYSLTGRITAVNTAYSEQYKNITVTISVEGCENMPIQCYRLTGDGAKELKVGDIITVTGIIKNYNGMVEFDQGCVFEKEE